eukprot:scaffold10264_cov44-Phaeocystis_antarctica.AAC.2
MTRCCSTQHVARGLPRLAAAGLHPALRPCIPTPCTPASCAHAPLHLGRHPATYPHPTFSHLSADEPAARGARECGGRYGGGALLIYTIH